MNIASLIVSILGLFISGIFLIYSFIINKSQKKVKRLVEDKNKLQKLLDFKSNFDETKQKVDKAISKYLNNANGENKYRQFTRKVNAIINKFIKYFCRVEKIISFQSDGLLKRNPSSYKTIDDYKTFLSLLDDLDIELDNAIIKLIEI